MIKPEAHPGHGSQTAKDKLERAATSAEAAALIRRYNLDRRYSFP